MWAYAVVLRLDAIDGRDLRALQLDVTAQDRIVHGQARLEELIEAGVQLRFYAWGYDSLTGAFAVSRSVRVDDPTTIVVDLRIDVDAS